MAIKISNPHCKKNHAKINLRMRLPLKAFCTNEKCWEQNEFIWSVKGEKCCERKVPGDAIYCPSCEYALVWSRGYREWQK